MFCINCGLEIEVCSCPAHGQNIDECIGYIHIKGYHQCAYANGDSSGIPRHDVYGKVVNARPDVRQIFIVKTKEPETNPKLLLTYTPKKQKPEVIVQDIIEIVEIPTRRKFKNIS
jgi:hypothetical protein